MIENISVSTFPDYVEEIFQTFLMATPEQLAAATQELNEMTPAPMNTMLEKQPVAEAIEKRRRRRAMIVEDVPPTSFQNCDATGCLQFPDNPFTPELIIQILSTILEENV